MGRLTSCIHAWALLLALTTSVSAQTAPPPTPSSAADTAARERIERFLRYLYAWGPETQVTVGPLLESRLPGIFSVLVQVTTEGRQVQDVLLTSGDARYIVRGDLFDTAQNPFAEALARIRLAGYPSQGPADAPVTIVEYGDFQCPDCRALAPVLKKILSQYPSVRLVWKDLPLTQIHKWALAAHVSARCIHEQSNEAFWRAHDYLFENQDQLTPDNLLIRLETFVSRSNLDPRAYRACRDQESTRLLVEESAAEAAALGVQQTPTLFVNGRWIAPAGDNVGPFLERLIEFELNLRQQGSEPLPR